MAIAMNLSVVWNCNGQRLELSPADTKVLWLLLQDSPDLLNKLAQRRKSFCESELLKINSLNDFWDKTWDFIKKLPGSFVQKSKEVIKLTTLCRFPKQVTHCERMVPKWSCGPSGDGKSEINEVEMGLCVYASFWCANSELVEFTKCCIVHDRCYIDRKGLTKCDGDFCNCLQESSKGKCYVFAGKVFCHVVKDLLGHFVYNVFLSFLYLIFNIF
uniref:Uncharacterized protein n=1 Tax=Meloidogyne enterolobii TaxID=390850 RepID=A0A6V7UW84_MELEN|nr:unnamed protein product [Meloidogyne enterolobii]